MELCRFGLLCVFAGCLGFCRGFVFACGFGFGFGFGCCRTCRFTFGADGFYDALQYIILLAATLACPIIIIPMLASSRYIVTEKELITKFGLIKSKYRLDDVMRLSLDRSTGKLSLYFKNDSFMIIVVNREWNDEFIEALREHHPAITVEYVENES